MKVTGKKEFEKSNSKETKRKIPFMKQKRTPPPVKKMFCRNKAFFCLNGKPRSRNIKVEARQRNGK